MSDDLSATELATLSRSLREEPGEVVAEPVEPTVKKTRRKPPPRVKPARGRPASVKRGKSLKKPVPAFVDLDEEDESDDEIDLAFESEKKFKTKARKPKPVNKVTDAQFAAMEKRGFHFYHQSNHPDNLLGDSSFVANYYASLGLGYGIFKSIPIVVVKETSAFTWEPVKTADEVTEAFKRLLHRHSYELIGTHYSRYGSEAWADNEAIKKSLNGRIRLTKNKMRLYYDMSREAFILPPTLVNYKKVEGHDSREAFDVVFTSRRKPESERPYNYRHRYRRANRSWPNASSFLSYLSNLADESDYANFIRNVLLSNFPQADVESMGDDDAEEMLDGTKAARISYLGYDTYVSTGKITAELFESGKKPFDSDAYLTACVESMISKFASRLEHNSDKLKSLQRQYMNLSATIASDRLVADMMRKNGKQHLIDVSEKMAKLPNVVSVKYLKRNVVFTTGEIWSEKQLHYGVEYPSKYLGVYEIHFDFALGSVKVRNIAMDQKGGYPVTPSTSKTGDFCIGGYGSIISNAMALADYETVLTAILEFVHDVHLGDGSALNIFKSSFFTTRPKKTVTSPYMIFIDGR